jgi:predicted RNase H-like HicB family nuclease
MDIIPISVSPSTHRFDEYTHVVSPIPETEGGGFLLTVPDLPGLTADGSTLEQAIADGREAFTQWVSATIHMGRNVPAPTLNAQDLVAPATSGRFLARVPRTMHSQLIARAKAEGVSLNTLAVSLLADGMGRRMAVAG